MAKTGRPAKSDAAALAAIADYMHDNPTLTATEAFRVVITDFTGEHSPDAARKRIVTKFNKHRSALVQAAAKRKENGGKSVAVAGSAQRQVGDLGIFPHRSTFEKAMADFERMERLIPKQSAIDKIMADFERMERLMKPSAVERAMADFERMERLLRGGGYW